MTSDTDLATLLAPITIADFTRQAFGTRSFVTANTRHDRARAELVDWPTFNDLLAGAVLGPDGGTHARVEVRVADRRLGPDDLCRPARAPGSPRSIDPSRLTHAVRGGARLVLHEVEALDKKMARLAQDIGRQLRISVTARLEAAWQSPWHARFETAETDFLLVQLAGSQDWAMRSPDHGQGPEATPLMAGALAYVPKGWSFRNRAMTFPTLQLYLELSPPTTSDLMCWLAGQLLAEDSTLRDPLPEDPRARAQEEAALLRRLTKACEDKAWVDRFRAEHYAAAIESYASFGFPWTATRDVIPPGDASLRLNGPSFPETHVEPDRVEYHMRGARFVLGRQVAEAFAPLFAGETKTVNQLLAGPQPDALREALIDLLLAEHVVLED